MAATLSWANAPKRPFARAEAFFMEAMASTASIGMSSRPMRKFSSDRCVWAPQSLSEATRIPPMLSCSIL